MSDQQSTISVIDPISPAIERVREILFRPFDLGKWFVIGFCAWLAYLGKGGGFNLRLPSGRHHGGPQADEALHHAKEFLADNLHWIIPVAIVVTVLMIIIGLVIAWLSSRGHFMLLHCVALNKAEVKTPWRKFKRQGNSLFLFRIVLGLISFVFFALFAGLMVLIGVLFLAAHAHPRALAIILVVFLSFIIVIPAAIVFALIKKFTLDFVVPVMSLRTTTCTAAWREVLTILSANKARFLLYILFQIVIAIAIGTIILAAVCVTCCCAACIFAIPYIGTVAVLPLIVFKRAYSLYYLRQFGPQFDVFSSEPAAA